MMANLRTKAGSIRPPGKVCRTLSPATVNLSNYDAAAGQIQNMKTAVQNPNGPKVQALLKGVYGEHGTNYDFNKVQSNVNALDNGKMTASIPTATFSDPKTIAAIDWTKGDKKSDHWTPGPVQFGPKFHGKLL